MSVRLCPETGLTCSQCGDAPCFEEHVRLANEVADDPDPTNPTHYRSHPSGVECISIVEHLNFCLGNAVKYVWRSGLKTGDPLPDLRKARWYVDREIARIEALPKPSQPKDTGT